MKRQTKKKLSQLLTVLMIIILLSVPMPTYAQGTMYEVIFSDYDDTVLDTQMVEENTSATAPADPMRDGYNFSGWDADFTNVTTGSAIQAQYIKTYDVTFEDDDGTIIETQTIEENTSATPPDMNSRDGEAFIGWSEASDNITSDAIITAQYTPSYMITSQEDFNNAINTLIDNFGEKAYLNFTNLPNGYNDLFDFDIILTPTNELATGNSSMYSNDEPKVISEIIYAPEYDTNPSEIDEVSAIIAGENLTSVDNIYNYIANLPNNPNDARDYDDGGQTAYSLLVGQHGVCAGYADLTKKMMEYAGHTASIGLGTWVNADRSMGIAHAWNTVNGQTMDTMNKNKDFTVYTKTQLENYEVPFNNTAVYIKDALPQDIDFSAIVNPDKPIITVDNYVLNEATGEIIVNLSTNLGTLLIDTMVFTEDGFNATSSSNTADGITYTTVRGITISGYGTETPEIEYKVDGRNKTFPVPSDAPTESATTYTVSFVDHDGSNLDTQTVEENTNAIAPTEPTRTGYTFTGWDVDFSNITSDLTITATYTKDIVPTEPEEPVTVPTITVSSYETNPTNQDITVTATTDVGTLNETSYTFTENSTFDFVATNDTESTTETITITNIDKTNPVVTVENIDTTETSDPVTVNVSTNEGTLNATTHTFTENGSFEFEATDNAGNTTTKTVTINHIVDPVVEEPVTEEPVVEEPIIKPTITIESYEQNPTNQDITVTATTDVGTLNEASYTFTENGSFKFIATNDTEETSKTIVIENIDKENPMITFIYDNSDTTDSVIVNVEAMDNDNIDSIFTPDEEWIKGNSLEYEVTENGDFLFKARDFANNIIEKMLTITNIVKTQEAPVEEDNDTVTDEPVIEYPVVEEPTVEEPVTDDTTENDTTEEPVIEDENDVVTEEPITDNDEEEIVEEDNSPAPSAPSAPSSGGGGGGGFTPPMFNPEQDVETTEKEIVEKEQDEILTKVESSSSINDIATSIDSYESPEDMDDDEFVEKIMVSLDKNSNLKESSDKESVKSIITNLVKSKKSENNKEKLLTELSFNKITDEKLKSDFNEVVKNNSVKINNIADAKKVIEDASFIDETVDNVKDTEVATMIKDKLEERLIVDNENELLASNDETIVKEKLEQEKKTVKAIESIMNANKEFNFYSDLRARTYIKNLEDGSLKEELSLIYNSMKVKHSATPLETKERPETPPILIDGRETDFSIKKSDGTVEKVNPFIKNGRTLSSVRVIAESLEADVNWFGEDQRIELVKDGKIVEMQIGSDKLFVDGKEQLMDIKPIIKDGRSYFPARFIAEGLESTVLWDDEYNTVFID